jgi:hyperosmotically inducible periplasmic protein
MTNSKYRNALIAAGIAAALGFGAAGCGQTTDESARKAETTRDDTRTTRDTRTAGDTRTAAEGARDAGDSAAQAASDTWITTKVKSVLLADSDAQGLDIKVNTKDGVVTLEGELASQAAIDHVKALAMDVEGVKRVDTNALTATRR